MKLITNLGVEVNINAILIVFVWQRVGKGLKFFAKRNCLRHRDVWAFDVFSLDVLRNYVSSIQLYFTATY